MRQALQKQIVFKKEHTNREIYQYIVDSEAPELYLALKPWYKVAKIGWIVLNIAATITACLALVWMSYPQYVETSSTSSLASANFLNIMEILCVLFFTLDYFLRFHASEFTFLAFAKQSMNVIDAVTTLPFYLQIFIASVGASAGDLFRLVYCIRMLRVVRLGRYHTGMRATLESLRNSATLLAFLAVMILMTLAMTSTAYYYAERTTYDKTINKWLRRCPTDDNLARYDTYGNVMPKRGGNCTSQIAPAQSIPDAMYWSVITISTVGFASETPTSGLGKAVAALTSILGIFYFAAPATVLSANYKKYRQKIRERKLIILAKDRLTRSMVAQEKLRREMERVYQLLHRRDHSAPLDPALQHAIETVKMEPVRQLIPACTFNYKGISRVIYQVEDRVEYVYEPLMFLKREDEPDVADMYTLDADALRKKAEESSRGAFGDEDEANQKSAMSSPSAAMLLSGRGSKMSQVSARGMLGKPPLASTKQSTAVSDAIQAEEDRRRTRVAFTDDFNRKTGERVLTCYLVMDSDEAQRAARAALEAAKLIPPGTTACDVQVHADRECSVRVKHDTGHIYPNMSAIVYLDDLGEWQAHCNQKEVPVRFIVVMPHLHGVEDALELLKYSRLHVSVSLRHQIYTMHIHVPIESIFATKFVREITSVALERSTDHHAVAYVHQADAALLLEGFCSQFIPTPAPDAVVIAPHAVDQQVLLALKAVCPSVRLDSVPLAAANSCFRSSHLTADARGDSALLQVDLTRLQFLDDMGHEHRFKVHVPLAEESLREAYFTLA